MNTKRRSSARRRPAMAGAAPEPPAPGVSDALARYQAGEASDTEMAALMQQLINTGSIQAVGGAGSSHDDGGRVWATIIPVADRLDIWVDGARRGSASNVALARYRVATAARPAKVVWTDPLTAHWDRPTSRR